MLLVCMPFIAFAQSAENSIMIVTDPQLLTDNVHFSAHIVGNAEQRASIKWYINGNEEAAYRDLDTIELTSPDIQHPLTLTAQVKYLDGSVATAKKSITTARIDMLVSANTLVPPFYTGRRLPSPGSAITVTALMYDKAQTSPSRFSYLWKVNGTIQNGGAIYGKNTLTFTPSLFDSSENVSVEVLNAKGTSIAARTMRIPLATPEVVFYEQNPLRGLSQNALQDQYIMIGDEATIRAEGYYMGQNILSPLIQKKWLINGVPVSANADPMEITLTKKGNSGRAALSFSIRNAAQLLQSAEKQIMITF